MVGMYVSVMACGVAGAVLHLWAWFRVCKQRQARFVASLLEFDGRGVFTRECAT